MGITASRMADTVMPITVTWGDESAEVGVRPGRITREMLREAADATADTIIDQSLVVIASWDVLDESGTPLPIEREVLEKLPFAFLGRIIALAVEATGTQGKG